MQANPEMWASLTAREREIAPLIAHGLSNKDICRALGLSVGTVHVHVNNILKKIGINRRAALGPTLMGLKLSVPSPATSKIMRAQALGLIDEDQARGLIEALPPAAA